MVPGAIKNSRNGKKGSYRLIIEQSEAQGRTLWDRDRVLHYSKVIVALRTETEHPRAREVDILGAPTGKEGYDANTRGNWELIISNSSACLNYP